MSLWLCLVVELLMLHVLVVLFSFFAASRAMVIPYLVGMDFF